MNEKVKTEPRRRAEKERDRMDEAKPQERKLLRTEITPTGVRVEYWSNEHGGEDVVAHLPMLSSQATAEDIGKAKK